METGVAGLRRRPPRGTDMRELSSARPCSTSLPCRLSSTYDKVHRDRIKRSDTRHIPKHSSAVRGTHGPMTNWFLLGKPAEDVRTLPTPAIPPMVARASKADGERHRGHGDQKSKSRATTPILKDRRDQDSMPRSDEHLLHSGARLSINDCNSDNICNTKILTTAPGVTRGLRHVPILEAPAHDDIRCHPARVPPTRAISASSRRASRRAPCAGSRGRLGRLVMAEKATIRDASARR
jgi:hypothetical protein